MSTYLLVRTETGSERSAVVDELTNEVEAGKFSRDELDILVRDLISALPDEKDPSVRESVMNLLSEAYLDIGVRELVDDYVVDSITGMPPAEVVHALAILAESAVKERTRILQDFAQSENTAIRETAASYLKQ